MAGIPSALYGYVHDGEDSFIAVMLDGAWYPLVFASKEKAMAPAVVALVNEVVSTTRKPAMLVTWGNMEPLAKIERADLSPGSAVMRPVSGQFAGELVEPRGDD